MQHAALHTTTVQPSSHNQRHDLIGKQWHQLPELIPTNSFSSFISFSMYSFQESLIPLSSTITFPDAPLIQFNPSAIRNNTHTRLKR